MTPLTVKQQRAFDFCVRSRVYLDDGIPAAIARCSLLLGYGDDDGKDVPPVPSSSGEVERGAEGQGEGEGTADGTE